MRLFYTAVVMVLLTMASSAHAEPRWVLDLMLQVSPPHSWPQGVESQEVRLDRYRAIARTIDEVVRDPGVRLPFSGSEAQRNTTVLLLTIAHHESGFRRDVDVGPCEKGWCDGGRSACLLQVMVGRGTTPEGWSKADLFADRRKCVLAGLRQVRQSFGGCRHLDRALWLTQYASGGCLSEEGRKRSQEMFHALARNAGRVSLLLSQGGDAERDERSTPVLPLQESASLVPAREP